MTQAADATVAALRAALEPLGWPERFERLAEAHRSAADPGACAAIVRLRANLADRALAELGPQWGGVPFKDAILRLPRHMRGPLTQAAKQARDRRVAEVMTHGGAPLEGAVGAARFGIGFDERSIELPLALATARLDQPGEVLDAGSALNLPVVRAIVRRPRARLTHFTLPGSKEPVLTGDEDRFVYAFGDLRAMPFPDGAFDRVVCVSTLEHVGMDTSRFGAAETAGEGTAPAVAELLRVLRPAGTLLATVPYGRAAAHGWFRVYDRMGIRALLEPAAPAEVAFRYFYYEHGWAEGGPQPPASVLDSPFFEDVVTGVAVATVVKQ